MEKATFLQFHPFRVNSISGFGGGRTQVSSNFPQAWLPPYLWHHNSTSTTQKIKLQAHSSRDIRAFSCLGIHANGVLTGAVFCMHLHVFQRIAKTLGGRQRRAIAESKDIGIFVMLASFLLAKKKTVPSPSQVSDGDENFEDQKSRLHRSVFYQIWNGPTNMFQGILAGNLEDHPRTWIHP